jgi:hypothetical protein
LDRIRPEIFKEKQQKMTFTTIQSQVTRTGAAAGSFVDVSGIVDGSGSPRDWTLKINVSALSDSAGNTPSVRFAFEDSVNAGSAYLAGPTFSFAGTVVAASDKVKSFKKADFPDLRIGVANALLRLRLSNLEVTGSVTYQAWLES